MLALLKHLNIDQIFIFTTLEQHLKHLNIYFLHTCFQQDDLILLRKLHEAWNHLCKFNNLLNNICQSLCSTNPQILGCLQHSKLISNPTSKQPLCCVFSHHFLELVHFEVVDPLRAAQRDLLPGQQTRPLVSLEDGVGEKLTNLVWIWNEQS